MALTEEDLQKEIRELKNRIIQMETMMTKMFTPIKELQGTTKNYFKLVSTAMKHGGLTPEMLLPEVKDDISKAIIKVLVQNNGQNISQLTKMIRDMRGTASRRIIRDKIKNLEDKGIIECKKVGAIDHYYISEEVLIKWSQMLNINI